MYLHKKYVQCTYCGHIVLQNTLLLLRWDRGRFKGGLRCKGWGNSVIINVNTEMNYRCAYT